MQRSEAVKTVDRGLVRSSSENYPDKTFIGRIERGFDFIGYRFTGARPQCREKND